MTESRIIFNMLLFLLCLSDLKCIGGIEEEQMMQLNDLKATVDALTSQVNTLIEEKTLLEKESYELERRIFETKINYELGVKLKKATNIFDVPKDHILIRDLNGGVYSTVYDSFKKHFDNLKISTCFCNERYDFGYCVLTSVPQIYDEKTNYLKETTLINKANIGKFAIIYKIIISNGTINFNSESEGCPVFRDIYNVCKIETSNIPEDMNNFRFNKNINRIYLLAFEFKISDNNLSSINFNDDSKLDMKKQRAILGF